MTSYENDCIFRRSYFGGRCEIFGNSYDDEMIYHFDFKGMYSQIMFEDFPIGDFQYKEPFEIKNIGFYFVTVFSNMIIPVLPYRSPDGKLIFPNGTFSGLYWYEELNYFVSCGGNISKIHYAYLFKNKNKPFKKFSQITSALRNNNFQNNFIFKLINNSLYGRLGMSPIDQETLLVNEEEFLKIEEEREVISYTIINDTYMVTIRKNIELDKKVKSNVLYASIITAKARIKLHKGFKSVEKNEGRILYCDTDSIFAAFKKNIDNQKHGDIF